MGWRGFGRFGDMSRPVRAGLITAMVASAAMVGVASPAAAGHAKKTSRVQQSAPSPSVMIQLSTLAQTSTPNRLRNWLDQICPSGVDPVGRLVLQDIATADGSLLTGFLDVVEPYLPGASRHPCFSRVFVGTIEPDWTGTGNAYTQGVQDPVFVADYLTRSADVAAAFVQGYPKVKEDWYLTYEANLNELYYQQVESAYLTLLTRELRSRTALRPRGQVMWSPAFWYPYSAYSQNTVGMAGLRTSLTSLFTALRAEGGVDVVDLQDYVSGSSCQPVGNRMTAADAVGWVHFLQGLGVVSEVPINTEQYALDCSTGGIVNGNQTEVQSRESFYRSRGLTLGPAFELRYWIPNHT